MTETKGLCGMHYQRLPERRERQRQNVHARLDADARRDRMLKHRYGMSLLDFEERLARQDGRCPICLTTGGVTQWHVHHDHKCCPTARTCGRCVIAILCAMCNRGLGAFKDDPVLLERAFLLTQGSGNGRD